MRGSRQSKVIGMELDGAGASVSEDDSPGPASFCAETMCPAPNQEVEACDTGLPAKLSASSRSRRVYSIAPASRVPFCLAQRLFWPAAMRARASSLSCRLVSWGRPVRFGAAVLGSVPRTAGSAAATSASPPSSKLLTCCNLVISRSITSRIFCYAMEAQGTACREAGALALPKPRSIMPGARICPIFDAKRSRPAPDAV